MCVVLCVFWDITTTYNAGERWTKRKSCSEDAFKERKHKFATAQNTFRHLETPYGSITPETLPFIVIMYNTFT